MSGRHNHKIYPGAKFGMLTVVKRLEREPKSNGRGFTYRILCRCDCGNEATPVLNSVSTGATKSCGCLNIRKMKERAREKAKNSSTNVIIRGARFGKLVVIRRIERDGKLTDRVKCLCDCGNKTRSNIDGLIRGNTRSCGCLASDLLIQRNKESGKYGCFSHEHPKTYSVWAGMVRKCYRENANGYERYGAIGVRVCRWLRKDPHNLKSAIGLRPSTKHSIDRFPIHNGNYTCGRCRQCKKNGWKLNIRWATAKQQVLNRGEYNVWIEAFGKRLSKSQWVELSGLSWSTFHGRLSRGWSVEEALTVPDKFGNCYKTDK